MSSADSPPVAPDPVILVVEDDRVTLEILLVWLEARYHCRAVGVEMGEVALELAAGQVEQNSVDQPPPVLVLMDLNLPGIDGFETARRLRAEPGCQHIPMVCISNECWDKDIHRRVCNEGFIGCIDKGRLFEGLPQYLNQVLRLRA